MSDLDNVASPCIGVCRMDVLAGVCSGCLRTRDEIAGWSRMLPDQKRQLLQTLEQRLAASVAFD